jgi:hypothetical protein
MQNFTITTDMILIILSSLCLFFILLTFIYSLKINKACKKENYKGKFIKKDSSAAKKTEESETKKGINSEPVKPVVDSDDEIPISKNGTDQIESKYLPREEKITKQYRRYLINSKINQGKDTDEGKIDWK